MPVAEWLMALASQAGNAIVAAAATDAWEGARGRVARLFGRSGQDKADLADRQLQDTRAELAGLTSTDLEQARSALAQLWANRIERLLEGDPGAAAGVRELITVVNASGASVAAGRDLTISAPGGIAAARIEADAIAGPGGTAIGRVEYRRREVASQPVSLPPRPSYLPGREDLLSDLRQRLASGPGPGPGPRLVALCGLAGVGKSSVAAEYAHRNLGEACLAWFLPAEDPALLDAEFTRLAGQLGVTDPVAPSDPVASVHGALAAMPAPWILVFDNAVSEPAVRRFLPPAGDGQVLITTQDRLFSARDVVDVPVLDPDTAAGFMVSRTGDAGTQAVELARLLGGLPLALEQAAGFMTATLTSIAGYLDLYRHRRADLLARGEAPGHPLTVAATLSLAISRLERDAPGAAGLLRLLACLAPEPIPVRLLLGTPARANQSDAKVAAMFSPMADAAELEVRAVLAPLVGDALAVADAIAALRRYSLITLAGDGLVLVHRLVQVITLDQTLPEVAEAWQQAAAVLTESAIPLDTALPEAWPACAALLPHAQAVLSSSSGGLWRIASYLGESGSYAAAREMSLQIADTYDQDPGYGPEHVDSLVARNNLAHWTGQAGDPAGARDLFAQLLSLSERVLGAEHPDTLAARHNLARWTGLAGDPAAAREQLAQLLPLSEPVLGAEHLDTLNSRHQLAYWTGEAGDPARARDLFARLLPVREQVLGVEHRATLGTRHQLAYWTGNAGDPAAARDLFAPLLPLSEQVLGADHPTTLTTRHQLAYWTGNAGDPAAARDQLIALLPLSEQVLGAVHPTTLTIRHALAGFTGLADDPSEARDQLAELLPDRNRVLGPDHPDTMATRHQLAYWTGNAGDPARARDQFAALLPDMVRVLGPDHTRTQVTRDSLDYWTRQAQVGSG